MYMSRLLKFASSRAAISRCNCLHVNLSALKPCSVSCRIRCILPYADNMSGTVLLKKFHIVLRIRFGQ